jgi:hypothetical protein
VRGCTVLPPPASTFFSDSSMDVTPIVMTEVGVSAVRCIRPPLMAPGSVGSRVAWSMSVVVTVVYMLPPPMSASFSSQSKQEP